MEQPHRNPYPKFWLIMGVSFVVMHAVMYLNVYLWDHVAASLISEMRFYMTSLMILAMMALMLGMMWDMYHDKRKNYGILAFAGIGFAVVLTLTRSQWLVDDRSWMKSMIPHHSIAILTSERADIDDVRVRELAEEIIRAQRREIAEMEWLLEDIARNGAVTAESQLPGREVPEMPATLYTGGPR